MDSKCKGLGVRQSLLFPFYSIKEAIVARRH